MEVFVLVRGYPYEGEDVLGVFSSEEKAKEAEIFFLSKESSRYCYYNIYEFIIDKK